MSTNNEDKNKKEKSLKVPVETKKKIEENKLVNFKGSVDSIGKIVKVKITKAKTYTLEGEEVHE